jgi:NAD(P)H-hydrate epimerase
MHTFTVRGGKTMTRDQVRDIDSWAIREMGLPGVVLMENAGRSCAELVVQTLAKVRLPKVIVFCGTGNNGGDGYVIARHLLNSGFAVTVCICGNEDKIKGDAFTNLGVLRSMGLSTVGLPVGSPEIGVIVERMAAGAHLIVDAVFGTGLSQNLGPDYVALIEGINALPGKKLAVDIPSGLDCDTGQPMPVAFVADMTVTFVAAKAGFACEGAKRYTGKVYVASIGIGPR